MTWSYIGLTQSGVVVAARVDRGDDRTARFVQKMRDCGLKVRYTSTSRASRLLTSGLPIHREHQFTGSLAIQPVDKIDQDTAVHQHLPRFWDPPPLTRSGPTPEEYHRLTTGEFPVVQPEERIDP